jgi:hypothetical protein
MYIPQRSYIWHFTNRKHRKRTNDSEFITLASKLFHPSMIVCTSTVVRIDRVTKHLWALLAEHWRNNFMPAPLYVGIAFFCVINVGLCNDLYHHSTHVYVVIFTYTKVGYISNTMGCVDRPGRQAHLDSYRRWSADFLQFDCWSAVCRECAWWNEFSPRPSTMTLVNNQCVLVL